MPADSPTTPGTPATKFPPIEPIRPPAGAPNVLIVLLDDVGFGASSAFGGPIHMPTGERLAGQGLRYTRFHTTALCSPTRAAMLSGRNHHSVGMGVITETASRHRGYNSLRPNPCASTRCGRSSPTKAAGSAEVATSRCTSTGNRPAKVMSTPRSLHLDAGLDSHDHLIEPEHLLKLAMTRQ